MATCQRRRLSFTQLPEQLLVLYHKFVQQMIPANSMNMFVLHPWTLMCADAMEAVASHLRCIFDQYTFIEQFTPSHSWRRTKLVFVDDARERSQMLNWAILVCSHSSGSNAPTQAEVHVKSNRTCESWKYAMTRRTDQSMPCVIGNNATYEPAVKWRYSFRSTLSEAQRALANC